METIDDKLNKFTVKLFLGFSEVISIVVASLFTVTTGLMIYYIRKHLYEWLRIIGINYFADRLKNIREINSDLIWVQGSFRADVYGLFRTYNGKCYVEDSGFPATNTDSKRLNSYRKIKVKKMNSKPDEFFPDELDKDLYKFIIDQTIINDWKLFSYDSVKEDNPNSPLLVFLESEFIEYLFTFRIWDKSKKTYGVILFAWNQKPDIDSMFNKQISKKLDSIAIRFQTHIEGSLSEKVGFRWLK